MSDTPVKKILLVDDDAFLLDMYAIKFSKSGYEVKTADSTETGLKTLRDGYVPDIMLIDIVMPGMDGVEALRRMLAEFGDHCHYYECPANEDGPCDCFAGNLVIDCLDVLGKAILEKKQG